MNDFVEPGTLAPTGLYLGGTKYMVIQGEPGAVIRGKKVHDPCFFFPKKRVLMLWLSWALWDAGVTCWCWTNRYPFSHFIQAYIKNFPWMLKYLIIFQVYLGYSNELNDNCWVPLRMESLKTFGFCFNVHYSVWVFVYRHSNLFSAIFYILCGD